MKGEVMEDPKLRQALSSLREDTLVTLTQQLIRLDSTNPPGREWEVAQAVVHHAKEYGLNAELIEVEAGRANVIVRIPGTGLDRRRLLYCGHLDTVPVGHKPWDHHPFGADLVEGAIWGRGAVDMKGGVAAMLAAMAALRQSEVELPGDLVFAGVVGEEVDCAGSRHFLASGAMRDVGWLVVAEPTDLDLVVAHKGALRIEVTTHGKAAHSSKPELGSNAIMHMVAVLERLTAVDLTTECHQFLTPPTLSVNTVDGGSAINVVPDSCRTVIDVRTLPSQDHQKLLAEFQAAVRDLTEEDGVQIELRILGEATPVETQVDHPLTCTAQRAADIALDSGSRLRGVTFFSDASVLQPATGVPTLLFGPGDDELAHQTNERVAVEALVKASRFLTTLPFLVWDA